MRDASHRDLIVIDVLAKSNPEHAPSRPLLDLVCRIVSLFERKQTAYWRSHKTRKIYVGEITLSADRSCVAMLIKSTTGNLPDEAFANLETDEERLVEMHDNEGKQESVHLLVSLIGESAQNHRYFAVLESGDVLTRAMVESYLNHLLKKVGQADPKVFSCPKPDGEIDAAGRSLKYRYDSRIELQGHLADGFRSDLEKGRLTGIDLIRALPDGGGPAEGRYVRGARQTLKLSSRTSWKDNVFESLTEGVTIAKRNHYDRLRVTFTSTDGMPHTVEIDPHTENVTGDSFVKKVRIGPFGGLKRLSCRKLDPEILQPMLGLLNKQRSQPLHHLDLTHFITQEMSDCVLVSTTQAFQLFNNTRCAEELL